MDIDEHFDFFGHNVQVLMEDIRSNTTDKQIKLWPFC